VGIPHSSEVGCGGTQRCGALISFRSRGRPRGQERGRGWNSRRAALTVAPHVRRRARGFLPSDGSFFGRSMRDRSNVGRLGLCDQGAPVRRGHARDIRRFRGPLFRSDNSVLARIAHASHAPATTRPALTGDGMKRGRVRRQPRRGRGFPSPQAAEGGERAQDKMRAGGTIDATDLNPLGCGGQQLYGAACRQVGSKLRVRRTKPRRYDSREVTAVYVEEIAACRDRGADLTPGRGPSPAPDGAVHQLIKNVI
jgi:hypothetical protein